LCKYVKAGSPLAGFKTAGPFTLDHFRLTKGRIALRQFLWQDWHNRKKGAVPAKVATVDRGIVSVVYVVKPNSEGNWGIEVALDRPMDPPCTTFRADSLARLPIAKPNEDYPSQT
jgi:hypothetical protein